MLQLSPRSTIALVGSSDGLPRDSDTVSRLCAVLESLGLHTVIFPSLYQTAAGKPQPAKRRAADIQAAFADPEVDALFDLTGGDAANAILPHLDFKEIARCSKPFFGYSDVSVLLNPLQDFGDIPVFYLQARFLASCSALDTAAGRCPVSISLCLFAGQFALRKGLRRQYPLHAEAHRHTVAARSHGTGTVSGELFRQFCSNGDYAAPIPANGNVLPMQRRVAGELFGTGGKAAAPDAVPVGAGHHRRSCAAHCRDHRIGASAGGALSGIRGNPLRRIAAVAIPLPAKSPASRNSQQKKCPDIFPDGNALPYCKTDRRSDSPEMR